MPVAALVHPIRRDIPSALIVAAVVHARVGVSGSTGCFGVGVGVKHGQLVHLFVILRLLAVLQGVDPFLLFSYAIDIVQSGSQFTKSGVTFFECDDSVLIGVVELDLDRLVVFLGFLEDLDPQCVYFQTLTLLLAQWTPPAVDVRVLLDDGPGVQLEAVDVFAVHTPHRGADQRHADRVFDRVPAVLVHEFNVIVRSVDFLQSFVTLKHSSFALCILFNLFRKYCGWDLVC